ncbi:MAG: TonB family protein, partial [Methyloceanibacter sp.]
PEPSSNAVAETAEMPRSETPTASANEITTAEADAPPTASGTATSTEAAAKEPEEPQPATSVAPAPPPPAPAQQAEQKPEPASVRRADKPTPAVTSQTQAKPGMRPMTLGFGGGLFKPPAQQAPTARAATPRAYGAAVRAAIGRHKPRAVGARGKATVTFSIGALGGLRSVGVSRSSGNKQLDQAAIASVRRAAPFPSPPAGSNPTYSLQIYFH